MKKIIFSLSIITIIGIIFPTKAFAADSPAYGGKLDRSVNRVSTYIGSGATNFQVLVLRAADNWTSPGWTSRVNFAYSPNNKGTMLDIYCFPKSRFGDSTNIKGLTTWYDASGKLIPWPSSGTYRYAMIEGNTNGLNQISIDRRTAVFAHEMGHAFGLDHNDSTTNSIMHGDTNLRALKVQKADTNTVNKIYPN